MSEPQTRPYECRYCGNRGFFDIAGKPFPCPACEQRVVTREEVERALSSGQTSAEKPEAVIETCGFCATPSDCIVPEHCHKEAS